MIIYDVDPLGPVWVTANLVLSDQVWFKIVLGEISEEIFRFKATLLFSLVQIGVKDPVVSNLPSP